MLEADRPGYDNILLPSAYQVGHFAGSVAPMLSQLKLLVALRCGEVHPPMLARAIATLDHLLEGRLALKGTQLDSPLRYRRSPEVVEILRQAWTRDQRF